MEDLGETVGRGLGVEPRVEVVLGEDDGHAFVELGNDLVGGFGDDAAALDGRLVGTRPGIGDGGEVELFAVR